MPSFVPHAAMAKLLGTSRLQTNAGSVRELLDELKDRIPVQDWERVRRATILVNGVAVHRLEGLDTSLAPDDTIWMVVASGGG